MSLGQSISDRLEAIQHTLVGSELSKIVCKATTTEYLAPKRKHINHLLCLTNEANINIADLTDQLIERTKGTRWIVVFKALITTHHLMCHGHERFIQNIASRNTIFNLNNFVDDSSDEAYYISPYIVRYSLYLNQKAVAYRKVAMDFTKIKRGKNGVLRGFEIDKLLDVLPILQGQIDALLEFDAHSRTLKNIIAFAAFMLLFKDLIRLFACYNDGIINMLAKFFELKKHQCRECVEAYKKFLARLNRVSEALKVAEKVGIDKRDIPDLSNTPNGLLESLEQHLLSLENKKDEIPHLSDVNRISLTPPVPATQVQKLGEPSMSALQSTPPLVSKEVPAQDLLFDLFSSSPSNDPQISQPDVISKAAPTYSSAQATDILDLYNTPVLNTAAVPQLNAFQGFPSTSSSFNATFVNKSLFPNSSAATTSGLVVNYQIPTQTGQNVQQPSVCTSSSIANYQMPARVAQGMQQPTTFASDSAKPLNLKMADMASDLSMRNSRANVQFGSKNTQLTGGFNYSAPTAVISPIAPSNSVAISPMGRGMMPPSPRPIVPLGNNVLGHTMMPLQQQQQQQSLFGMPGQQNIQSPQQFNPNNPFRSM